MEHLVCVDPQYSQYYSRKDLKLLDMHKKLH